MEIVVASRNSNKLGEIKKLLQHLPIKVLSPEDIADVPEVIEDGATYGENAIKKASAVAQASGKIALADDSGLEVDALQGQPGIKSARFGGEDLSDHERYMRLLKMMEDVPDDERGAVFQCVVAITSPTKVMKVVEGSCRGTIIRVPQGGGGFGYDPIFVPWEYSRSFAELSPEIKNKISHRARALEKAALFLEGYIYSQMEE